MRWVLRLRTGLLIAAVIAFVGIGVIDVAAGSWKTGVASLLLAVVNALFLSAG